MARVTFIEHNGQRHAVDVTPGDTLMAGAVWNRVPGIVAKCGGEGGCATCQVYIGKEWEDRVGQPSPTERRTLRFAFQARPESRLACQIVITDMLAGLVVHMPPRQI